MSETPPDRPSRGAAVPVPSFPTRGEEGEGDPTLSRKARGVSSPRERAPPATTPPPRTRAVRGFSSRSRDPTSFTIRAPPPVALTVWGGTLRYPWRVTKPERKSFRLQTFQPP